MQIHPHLNGSDKQQARIRHNRIQMRFGLHSINLEGFDNSITLFLFPYGQKMSERESSNLPITHKSLVIDNSVTVDQAKDDGFMASKFDNN